MKKLAAKIGFLLCILLLCAVSTPLGQDQALTDLAGGQGGSPFSDSELRNGGRIIEVQIFAGELVDAVQLAFELPDGRIVQGQRHGGPAGRANSLRLDSDEYITGISGRSGDVIDSISIQTNKRTSPIFGGAGGTRDYRIAVPPGNQAIGFTGRSAKYLDAIGLIFAPVSLRQVGQTEIYGGRGGSSFADRDVPSGARMSEIRIRAGERIDGIQAIYVLRDGRTVEGSFHGGGGGRVSVFRLDSDEYVTGIQGRYGETIDSIAFRTNKRTSPLYGGRGGNRDYKVDLPRNSAATGFAGRSGEYVDAIGLTYESVRNPVRNIPRGLPGRRRP